MNSPPTILASPNETLKQFGFLRSGSCSCGGTRNEIYKKDVYILYYRKTRHVFKIKQKNEVVVPITSLANLETELKKLFPNAVALAKKV
jgi:hypothetical protein